MFSYPLGNRISSLAEPKGLGIGSINLPKGPPGIKVRRAASMVPRTI